jgi:hypothetical protein
MTMNLVGQEFLFEVPSPLHTKGEDIVYSMIERHSRKASEPTTTRSFTTSSLILIYLRETLGFLESLFIIVINVYNTPPCSVIRAIYTLLTNNFWLRYSQSPDL